MIFRQLTGPLAICTAALCVALGPLMPLPAQAQQAEEPPAFVPETPEQIRDRIFYVAQTAQSSVAGRALAQAATRIAASSAELGSLLRDRQDTADLIVRLTERLANAAGGTGSEAEALIASLQASVRAQRAKLARLDDQLDAEFPEFKELTNPAPMTVAEVQATLDPDEALILTFTDLANTYVWAISPTDVAWHRADIGTDVIAEMVKLLRSQLSVTEENRAGKSLKGDFVASVAPFDRQVSYQLYEQLLEPLEPIFGEAAHVMLVVDGPLTSLPASILVTRPPQGQDTDPAAMRQTDWMIREHALTTLPSVSALRVLRQVAQRDAEAAPAVAAPQTLKNAFVGFGDPLLGYRLASADTAGLREAGSGEGTYTRGVYEDVTQVADLSPLPNTAKELRRLAATMGSDESGLYLGARATETEVKAADLHDAEVVAFATHGLLANGLPGLDEPALVFTPPAQPSAQDDALLTASEAAQLKLSASLVILSACDTAGGDGTPGADGLSGLARAFIYAGARAILVSHWPVDDYAASVLTTGMLDRMYGMDHRSRAEALQASIIDLMDDRSDDRYAHPKIWAPFVVVGEGGRDRI